MTKLSTLTPARPHSVIKTLDETSYTYEGGKGHRLDQKGELFLFAISNMVGEDSFYESASQRDTRFRELVASVTKSDPDWILRFIPYLRNQMYMRSASIVMAVEYVIAGGPHGRQAIDSAIARADEPGEVLGYYRSRIGRSVPQPIKRGIADAVRRLYSERNVIRYKDRGAYKIPDVLRITHPSPVAPWQSELFGWALGKNEEPALMMVASYQKLMSLPVEERRKVVTDAPAFLDEAGMTWEAVAGWLQGPMDAQAWEALIPNMGYMALIRNLRNFEQAGISDEAKAKVIARIEDPAEVARSKQFPFRFYSAYKNVSDFAYAAALSKALDLSTQNVPKLKGRTLVLIDGSASMEMGHFSKRGTLTYAEQAFLFGAALAKANDGNVDMHQYSADLSPAIRDLHRPLLRIVENRPNRGSSTYTYTAMAKAYSGHARVVVFTDMQSQDSASLVSHILAPVYVFNIAGYDTIADIAGKDDRYLFGGGLTDAAFRMIPLLEAGKNADWPF